MVRFHIAGRYPQKEIKAAGHLETLHDFGEFCNLLLELQQGGGGVIIQEHLAEGYQAPVYLLSVQDCNDPLDKTLLFQAPDSFMNGCDRLMQFVGDFFVREQSVFLQDL